MLNSGEKRIVLRATKIKYSNSRVVRKKISERKKNIPPPANRNYSSILATLQIICRVARMAE